MVLIPGQLYSARSARNPQEPVREDIPSADGMRDAGMYRQPEI